MTSEIITWDIYQISTVSSKIKGVQLRGRIRKFSLLHNINLLTENASDEENTVRFAIIEGTKAHSVVEKIKEMVPDSTVKLVRQRIHNPVLSKLKVNITDRYTL